MKLYLLGLGLACVGASTAATGNRVHASYVALAGGGIWLFAAALVGAFVLRRYMGIGRGEIEEGGPVARA